MDELLWQDAYCIGNETIDAEHRHLVELAHQVDHFAQSGESQERIRAAVQALCDYIRTHFASEEAFMVQAGYQGLAAHKALHEAITHEMNEILRGSASLDSVVYKLKRLVKTWVLGHIKQEDQRISMFQQRTAEAQPAPESEPPPAT